MLKPTITLAPIGGLCNRMRAINASLTLAAEIGSNLEIVWYRDSSLNCLFDELFVVPESVLGIIDVDLHGLRGVWSKKLLSVRRFRMGKHFFNQNYISLAMGAGIDLRHEFEGKDVFVETCSAYHPAANFGSFVPVPALAEKISDYAGVVAGAVGVHLRRTDNEMSLKYSPVGRFVEKMEASLASGRCNSFFLATDSPVEEKYLKDVFPGKIFTHPKTSCNRDISVAIKDALIDLYCLSQCKEIIGSYWSSFSETAASIGNKELYIIKDELPC